MQLIDTHHHLWDLGLHRYHWNERVRMNPDIEVKDYVLDDFKSDTAGTGVVKSVHVQAEMDHSVDPAIETRWLQSIADSPDSNGFPHAIVAYADLSAKDVRSILKSHVVFRGVRGIRQILSYSADDPAFCMAERDFLMDPQWRDGLKIAGELGLSFDLQLNPWQMADAALLVMECPGLLFILNHAGSPHLQAGRRYHAIWREGMEALATLSNVAVKISGLFKRGVSDVSIRASVESVIDWFGPQRCMFGSNSPIDCESKSYGEIWSFYSEAIAGCKESERRMMLVTNAEKYYRI